MTKTWKLILLIESILVILFLGWCTYAVRNDDGTVSDYTACEDAEKYLRTIAKDPDSVKVYSSSVVKHKTVDTDDPEVKHQYYLITLDASATNSFGGRVREWYVVELIYVAHALNNPKTKNNYQTFDSKPTKSDVDFCAQIFGW